MKRFNTTGLCIPEDHYMCDVSAKFARCKYLVEEGYYYAINFPRQYGKTTMQFLLGQEFGKHADYLVISTSFEGIGDIPFESEATLAPMILKVFAKAFRLTNRPLANYLSEASQNIKNFDDLSGFITEWIASLNKKVVLIIDEVDKASNNQVFISFIAMLRDKYLEEKKKLDLTFHSVILLGVHDVKSLKLKLRSDEESKLNSPWNISENLNVDFSFSALEIEPMLVDYANEHNFAIDCVAMAEKIYYYTSGNPFLVSLMCKVVDENLISDTKYPWTLADIEASYSYLINLGYTTTNFDDLYKNLENNTELRSLVQRIAIDGEDFTFDVGNTTINQGKTFGILSQNKTGRCDISNKIYEFRIMNYLLSRQMTLGNKFDLYRDTEFKANNELNIVMILEKFQLFMKEHNSSKDNKFLEKNGRLLLMSFLRPIINGKGFMFKENVTAEDRKMDLVITYNDKRYVIELKIWYGEKYLTDGIEQLCEYLDSYSLDEGYMLIYNFNKNKQYETKIVENCRKNITAVFV